MSENSEQEIRTLIHRAAELIDSGDPEFGKLFERGETKMEGVDVTDVIQGYGGTPPRMKHLLTNVMVDAEPGSGTATARSYWTVHGSTPEFPLHVFATGRYRDRFERDENGWYFTERVIVFETVADPATLPRTAQKSAV